MTRFVSLIALVGLLLISAAAVMIFLAYGIDGRPPSLIETAAVTAETELAWHDEYVRIEAPDEASLYVAMGFAHGTRRAWTINLWRQVALGRTSAWYGSPAAEIDNLALQLGLASNARVAYAALPDDTRELLQAYAEGVNMALGRRSARLEDEFTILGISPEAWEPWHSLAVEKLFAWQAASALPDSMLVDSPQEARVLAERAASMSRLLALHDLDQSAAFVTSGPEPIVGVRYVYGSSAEPILEEHELVVGGNRRIAAVLPGTPFAFVISEPGRVFALLPNGETSLSTLVADTLAFTPSHERMQNRAGEEYILSFLRGAGRLVLAEEQTDVPVDTLVTADSPDAVQDNLVQRRSVTQRWVLDWHGIEAPSDAASFAAVLRGDAAEFSLFRGGSVVITSEGGINVVGSERDAATIDGAVAVGHATWVEPLAARLAVLQTMTDSLGAEAVMSDVQSAWAESYLPFMLDAAASIPDPPRAVEDALTYLRNWNYHYDGSTIAASVFDEWMSAYRDSTGALPVPGPDDSLFTERYLRYQLLAGVVDSMTERYGSEMSQWRWERTRPDRRYAAGFPPDDDLRVTKNRRYEPIDLPGRGHPSTIRFGATPVVNMPFGSGAWEAWASLSAPDSLTVRRRAIDVSSFRGRYMISDREPPLIDFMSTEPEHRTTLRPRP